MEIIQIILGVTLGLLFYDVIKFFLNYPEHLERRAIKEKMKEILTAIESEGSKGGENTRKQKSQGSKSRKSRS